MRRIRVSLAIDSLGKGGSQRLLRDLAVGLDASAFEVRVCALAQGGVWEPALRQSGIPVSVLHKRLGVDLRVLPRLVKYLREFKPDIMHTFLFTANASGRIAALMARVPIIIATEHSGYVYPLVLQKHRLCPGLGF